MSYNYYPQSATGLNYVTYPAGPNPLATLVSSSASANTKGSYAEIVSATGFAANGVWVEVQTSTASGTGGQVLLDLAVGAAGSEVVVIPNLMIAGPFGTTSIQGSFIAFFPLAIASGARVAARMQDSLGTGTARIGITLVAAGDTPGCSSFVAYGVDTSTSVGTSIDPGASANTKGSYVQLTASTSAVCQYAVLVTNGRANTAPSAAVWAMDLATGGAGSESVLARDLRGGATPDPGHWTAPAFSFPTYIAASTRLSVRASCNITDATDRLFRAAIYLATAPAEPSGGGGGGGSSTWFGGA